MIQVPLALNKIMAEQKTCTELFRELKDKATGPPVM